MILNTKRIHNSFWRNFPARARQMPSKVLFVGKKKRRQRPFGQIVIVGNSKCRPVASIKWLGGGGAERTQINPSVDPFKLEDIEILDTYMNGRRTKCNLATWVPSCFICNIGILKNTFIKSYLNSTTPPYWTVSLSMIIIWGVIYWWVHGEMYWQMN